MTSFKAWLRDEVTLPCTIGKEVDEGGNVSLQYTRLNYFSSQIKSDLFKNQDVNENSNELSKQ